jgi:hypothetical protein
MGLESRLWTSSRAHGRCASSVRVITQAMLLGVASVAAQTLIVGTNGGSLFHTKTRLCLASLITVSSALTASSIWYRPSSPSSPSQKGSALLLLWSRDSPPPDTDSETGGTLGAFLGVRVSPTVGTLLSSGHRFV